MTLKNYINNTRNMKKALYPGHTACAGCGELLAVRHALEAAGPNTIVTAGTGCSEVTTSAYPTSSFGQPWIHSVFANAPSVASGVLAALKFLGKDKRVKVIAQGGDGATFDIGYGALSGMWTRNEDILYICYDNEAYMNTGIQASGATLKGAATTTSPVGKKIPGNELAKKDMPALAIANGCVYVATATAGYPLDIRAKVKKALTIKGPKYIQILSPCVPGWGIATDVAIKVGKLAQQTGLYPMFEAINGEITKVMKVPSKRPPVTEYLELQKRFKHTLKDKKILNYLQTKADENIVKYSLK